MKKQTHTQSRTAIEPLELRIAPAGVFKWNANFNGVWDAQANWVIVSGDAGAGFPNGPGDVAQFTDVITANRVITITDGVTITVGGIVFSDDNSYTIQASGSGKLVINGTDATISVLPTNGSAQHTISAPIGLQAPLTIDNETATAFVVSGAITGTDAEFGVTKDGPGGLDLSGSLANSYAGPTVVLDGTLRILKAAGVAGVGAQSLTIGDDVGTPATAKVLTGAANVLGNVGVIVKGDGELDLTIFSQAVPILVFDTTSGPASVKTGTGVLSTGTVAAFSSTNSGTATLTGQLALTGTAQVQVAGTRLDIGATISGSAGLLKTSDGTLVLSSATPNTYTGTTSISGGTLELRTTSSDAGISNSILVGADGVLRVLNSFEIPDNANVVVAGRLEIEATEDFTNLAFDGGGTVAIGADANFTIRAGGSVGVATNADGAGAVIEGPGTFTLTSLGTPFSIGETRDDGDLTITALTRGLGGISKTGAGTLVLANANTFTGAITVTAGTLALQAEQDAALVQTGGIVVNTTSSFGLAGSGSLTATAGRFDANTRFATGNMILGANLTFAQSLRDFFDGFQVTGFVNLANARLDLSVLFRVVSANPIVLIENDGTDAITGTFFGLPEGATLVTPRGNFTISYAGGDGNDVALTPAFIAPTILPGGKAATFTDVDGDLVRVSVTAGTLTPANFVLLSTGETGARLASLLLNEPEFAGASVKVAAARKTPAGDGRVDVLTLRSIQDLGAISIAGDLGSFSIGSAATPAPAFKALTVGSLGLSSPTVQGSSIISRAIGGFGKVTVKGDVVGANLDLDGAGTTSGSITIGGSVLPGPSNGVAAIEITGNLGKLTIGGDLVRSDSPFSKNLVVTGNLGRLSIGGSVIGGGASSFTNVSVTGNVTAISIGRDLTGGDAGFGGSMLITGNLGALKLGGDILGGAGASSGRVEVTGNAKTITVLGDVRGGSGEDSGSIEIGGLATAVKIGGSLFGGAAGSGLEAERFGTIAIGRELAGTNLGRAVIAAKGLAAPASALDAIALASLTVGRSVTNADVLAGYDGQAASPFTADAQIGKIAVKGSWTASRALAGIASGDGIFGNGDDAVFAGGNATIASRIASIVIGGRVEGTFSPGDGFGFLAEQIGALKIATVKYAVSPGAQDSFALGSFGDTVAREI